MRIMGKTKPCLVLLIVACFCSLMTIEELRIPLYAVPAAMVVMYIVLQAYPTLARRMHERKLTYEDLEDLHDTDPEIRRRFQIVFTRIQQIGGAICAGIIVQYAFYVFEKKQSQSFNQIFGILGGLLSLYARIFAYVGRFSMGCLDSMRRSQTELQNIDSSAE
jgi:hypothetical protein